MKLLREKGIASAAKRAGRETSEGTVLAEVDGAVAAIVAIGCETEPVSKNDEFQAFAREALAAALSGGEDAVGALDEQRIALGARLGENIQIVGVRRLEAGDGESFATYIHPPGKVGVLVKTRGGSPELARQLAMHISFSRPSYATRDEVPADLVASEREILAKLPEVESKPANVRDKIVEGMLNKRFFAESVLGEQAWIHEDKLNVTKALAQGGFELVDYAWFSVG
jgi:elongation factor Ts